MKLEAVSVAPSSHNGGTAEEVITSILVTLSFLYGRGIIYRFVK